MKFDGTDLAHLEQDNFASPVLRLGVGLQLFFARPFRPHAADVLEVWKRLRAWRGEVFTWGRLAGSSRTRQMNAGALKLVTSWLDGTKDPGRFCSVMAHDGATDELGTHSFVLEGNDEPCDPDSNDTTVNYLDIHLPLELAEDPDLAAHLHHLAEPLEFMCGTAGLMLHMTPYHGNRWWGRTREIVEQYHGVEPHAAERQCWRAYEGLVGVNWLTFVGRHHAEALGGLDAIEAVGDVRVTPVGAGLALQAGDRPRLGRAGFDMEPYRAVYALLEPAISFDDELSIGWDAFDGPRTVEWLKRFET